MTEPSGDIDDPNAGEAPGSPAPTSVTPATPEAPATPHSVAAKPQPWTFTVVAVVVLATAIVGVMVLAGRPGASRESPVAAPGTAVPASRPLASPSSSEVSGKPDGPSTPKWTGSRTPGWATDGSRTITFELEAESDVPVWSRTVRPLLGVRCLGGSTEVFVTTGWAASIEGNDGSHAVRVGFDGRAGVEQRWSDSSDYQSLFAPDGKALARQIAGSKRMRFEFTPYNATPVVVDFDVHGFDQLVDSIAKVCRWKR